MGVRVALAAVVLAVVVAGCDSGDPSPTTVPSAPPSTAASAPPTTPATTTPAPSPSPTPPPQPALSRQDSPAGAESFARYYIAVLDYAYQSGSTKALRQLARCPGCAAVADGIDKWVSAGGRYEGGHLRVTKTQVVNHVTGSAGLVAVTYSRTARQLVAANGTREVVKASPSLNVVMTERREPSGWLITNIQTVK